MKFYEDIKDVPQFEYTGGLCLEPHTYINFEYIQDVGKTYEKKTYVQTDEYYLDSNYCSGTTIKNIKDYLKDNNFKNYSFYLMPEQDGYFADICLVCWNNAVEFSNINCKADNSNYADTYSIGLMYEKHKSYYTGESPIQSIEYSKYMFRNPYIVKGQYGNFHILSSSTNMPYFKNKEEAYNFFVKNSGMPKSSSVNKNNVVVPIQYPQTFPGIITANPYAFQDLATYAQTMAQTIADLIAQNNPAGDTEIEPLPYTPEKPYILPEITPLPEVKPYILPEYNPGVEPSIDPSVDPSIDPTVDPTIDPTVDPSTKPSTEFEPQDFDDDEWKKIHFLDLSKKFPFCIPFDLIDTVRAFKATPKEPAWDIPIKYDKIGLNEIVHIDFRQWEKPILFFRGFVVLAFIVALILITKKMLF